MIFGITDNQTLLIDQIFGLWHLSESDLREKTVDRVDRVRA